ncbi:DUF1183-domain-containing protein [Laetiporus sulphureus 93-53]|uniref:Store-operated calcium entry-associated regulatory factor n=1 Tax=Laetiporus sulphureus 93-53 TaxID=1314785 RepID=A0A165E2U7_9APHY|nr:DUF1183-domain-containing protein [Laetiporus sulphureus 93-53]KZT06139.1 DUF1183-domain-containing protein [Laetiporus sulphureus 93-53]
MARHPKVALSRIKSLTFYKDSYTTARRTQPLPQLICIGKPCNVYQPEVVRCTNVGGEGTDVDWKCEADLPEALRFGRVEVSCEGWSGPGDPDILKGSCSLEYRLVQVPNALRAGDEPLFRSRFSNWLGYAYNNPSAVIFTIIWTACLLLMLYSVLKSCWGNRSTRSGNASRSSRPRPPAGGGGFGGGWFSGNNPPDHRDPPPPYTKHASSSSSATGAQNAGIQPGFWTGAALGGLGTYLFNRSQRDSQRDRPRPVLYDWEDRVNVPIQPIYRPPQSSRSRSDDRGEGSSNLGSMRRSTGIGGSNVR